MAAKPHAAKPAAKSPRPTLGRIVTYRNRNGADIAAIVTGHAQDGGIFLAQFPPPSEGADLIDPQYGVAEHAGDSDPRPGTWRWPDRTLE